ncbi:UDP-N-acetylglucosamine 2-epimerase (non-hydrolyzing) [Christiangramia fulva]|uniref:UDP-N-acetylglucosamine 2-epimerase (non-hydrolyzing) n=1 Tax=Christiangramia fulva TaxID=2126553 RepID=A0A2R3Z9P2_9FLAO|nr:UDP-N-acetylglucosamine 2-epimerase (non-hydrolyzing) [Christiangramia fulva]AVR46902.1 UDP-N-acetylglucosamine 2-epimerase (non-hydrolyzing) [Christiangramia fulva]
MKVAVIFGTRPEAIKLAPIIKELEKNGFLDVTVISTGQHKEMLEPILEWFEISPDYDLELMKPNQTLSSLSALCIERLEVVLNKISPDLLITQGDTTTAFISSLVAFYNKIKVAHVEAGLRTYNNLSPWPEEVNRNLISKIADFHFAPTDNNKNNLLQENVTKEKVFVTGNTVIDALLFSAEKVTKENIYPEELEAFFTGGLKEKKLVLITGHRRENFGKGFIGISEAIRALANSNPNVYFIYPLHLNPNVQETVREYLSDLENVKLIKPLGYPEFISAMKRSTLILTDSGGVQEEGPGLGKPILVMRDNTERPEALKHGTVKLVGTNKSNIINAVQELLSNKEIYDKMANAVNPYGDGTAAKQIVSILQEKKNLV